MVREVVKARMKGEAHEIRFADDAILCFEHKEDAEKVKDVLTKRFHKFGLTLHPEKSGWWNLAICGGEREETGKETPDLRFSVLPTSAPAAERGSFRAR